MLTKEDEWAARFWSKIDIRSPDECWEWKGCRHPQGYGWVRKDGKMQRAHRVAWALVNGLILKGLCVLHKCDNPPCCNPAHLFLGTLLDNNQDAARKGRMAHGQCNGTHTHPERVARGERQGAHTHPECVARGERHGSHTHPEKMRRGENHGMAKLTDRHVLQIRERYKQGGITQRRLAAEYDVTQAEIWNVIHCRIWKHVEDKEEQP